MRFLTESEFEELQKSVDRIQEAIDGDGIPCSEWEELAHSEKLELSRNKVLKISEAMGEAYRASILLIKASGPNP